MGGRKNPGPPPPLRQGGETLTAERRDVQIQKDSRRRVNGDLESYRVLACPEFEEG